MQFITFLILLVYMHAGSSLAYTEDESQLFEDDLSYSFLAWKLNRIGINRERSISTSSSRNAYLNVSRDVSTATDSPISNYLHIRPSCEAFIKEFGLRSSNFIKCSVDNARPFRFCEGCVIHYQKSATVYQDIVDNGEKLDNCGNYLLNADRIQVISSIQHDIDRIWKTADCKNCFSSISEDVNGTVHYQLTDNTKQFFTLYNNFTKCIPTNKTYNETTCKECRHYYLDMNTMYNKLLNDPLSPQHVCMDIVDMMNYTRLTWGEQLNCTTVHKESVAVLLVAMVILIIPLVFYMGLGAYGTKRIRNLIQQKRLASFQYSSNYGTLDSPSVDNPTHYQDSILSRSHDSANQSDNPTHYQDSILSRSHDSANQSTSSYTSQPTSSAENRATPNENVQTRKTCS